MSDVSPTNLNEKLRSSKRLPISMPIVLSGSDVEGHAFLENTQTVVVNKGGAKILSKHNLKVGIKVLIRIPHLNREAPLSVVWVSDQKKDKNHFEVGVGLEKPSDFWGVHFPEEHEIANRKGGPGSDKQAPELDPKKADPRITQAFEIAPAPVLPPTQAVVAHTPPSSKVVVPPAPPQVMAAPTPPAPPQVVAAPTPPPPLVVVAPAPAAAKIVAAPAPPVSKVQSTPVPPSPKVVAPVPPPPPVEAVPAPAPQMPIVLRPTPPSAMTHATQNHLEAPQPPPMPSPEPQTVVTPVPAVYGTSQPAVLTGRMLGVMQEFVNEALESSITAVLRQSRQKAEEDLARARQEVLEQAQQLLRQEVESARARQEQHAAEAGIRISALVAEAVQAGIQSAQDALIADRTASVARFRQAAVQESEAVQEGLRRAGQEIVGRVREQLTQASERQNEDFERDIQDALRSRVAGWSAFVEDSERTTAARVQAAIGASVSQTLEQAEHSLLASVKVAAHQLETRSSEMTAGHSVACQEALESAVRAARLRFASLLHEFDSGLADSESRAAGHFETTLEEAKRRSSEQAEASFAQLAGESAQRHGEICKHAEENLAKATSDRMHGHLTHFEMRLSEFERRAAASLENTLSGIMERTEEDCRGKLEQAGKSSMESVQTRLEGAVSSAVQRLDAEASERLSRHAAGVEARVGEATTAALQSVSRISQETVASAQKDGLEHTQVLIRRAVESALEQLEMRAIGVVHHNEQACNQALTALADAHEARLSAHLAECQVKLSNGARKILQELARSLASLNFGTEKPVE